MTWPKGRVPSPSYIQAESPRGGSGCGSHIYQPTAPEMLVGLLDTLGRSEVSQWAEQVETAKRKEKISDLQKEKLNESSMQMHQFL